MITDFSIVQTERTHSHRFMRHSRNATLGLPSSHFAAYSLSSLCNAKQILLTDQIVSLETNKHIENCTNKGTYFRNYFLASQILTHCLDLI